MPHWRAIQVKTRREHKAALALAELDIPIVLPTVRVRQHRKGSPYSLQPLFPGYLFADLYPSNGRIPTFHEIRHIPCVIDIIGSTPIPTTVMDAITNPPANVCFSTRWVPGYSYRLKSPRALAGLLVRLERLDTQTRASVMMHLLGAERVVSIALSDLEEQ